MPEKRKRSRARRVLGVIGAVVGTTVTFVAATATAAVVHLDVPATRRLVATQVTNVLADQFAGKIAIEHIHRLGLRGVSGVRVRIADPDGVQVIRADGVQARIDTPALVRSLFGKGDLRIPIDLVTADDVDVALDGDAQGDLRLAKVFQPKHPKPAEPAKPGGRGTRVEIPDVEIRHAWVHGAPGGAPPADADLTGLLAAVHVTPEATRLDVDELALVARDLPPRGADLRGDLTGKLVLPSAKDAGMIAEATLAGDLAGAPTEVWAAMDGKKVDARVDVRDVTADRLGQAVVELPISDTLALHAEAHGELPHVEAKANATLGRGTAVVTAVVDLGDRATKIRTDLAVRHVDLRKIVASAPPSDLGLDAHGAASIGKDGDLEADLAVDTIPGTILNQKVPRIVARAYGTKDSAWGAAHIYERDMSTEVAVALTPQGADKVLDAQVRSSIPDLRRVPYVGSVATGSVDVRGEARMNLTSKALVAFADVTGRNLAKGEDGVEGLRALARVSGSLDHPLVDASMHASNLHAGGMDASGLDARARVAAGRETVLEDARVDVTRRDVTLSVAADRVAIGPSGAIRVDGGEVLGLGDPVHLSVTNDARTMAVVADAPRIDVARIGKLLGKEADLRGGTIGLQTDVRIERGEATGQLHAKLVDLSTARLRKSANARIDARIVGRDVDLDLQAALANAGKLSIKTAGVKIGGSALDARSWEDATGRVDIGGEVDLARASWLVPYDRRPVELRGKLALVGGVTRASADAPPDVDLSGYTLGLVVAGKTPQQPPHGASRVHAVAPWRSDDTDVGFDVHFDALSRDADLAFRLVDRHGAIAAFDAKTNVPYEQLAKDPSKAVARLEETPFRAKLSIPRRSLDELPEILGIHNVAGSMDAELNVEGTALEPNVDLVAHLHEMRGEDQPKDRATDSDLHLTYDGKAANLDVKAKNRGKEVLALASKIDVRVKDVLRGEGREPAWDGAVRANLQDFPLESVDPIASRRIHGHLSGQLALEGLHEDARLHVDLGSNDLRIGGARYTKTSVVVDAKTGGLVAKARLEQKDGFAEVDARTGLTWGASPAPSLDKKDAVQAKLVAKHFRAAAIAPFVQGVFNELDGNLDANATLKLGPRPEDTQMAGTVAMRDGKVQVAAIGEELHDVRFDIALSPDGTIRLANLQGKGIEGMLSGSATVKTKGLALDDAHAELHIPERHPLDVAMQGQPIGRVSAEVKVDATATPDMSKLNVKVAIPTARIELPQSQKTGLQDLTPPDDVRVGTFRSPHDFVQLPLDKDDKEGKEVAQKAATETVVDIDIGNAVIVRGQMARIVVVGRPHIDITDKARMSGQIQVKEGKVDVQGKEFDIEKGIVTLQPEDSSDPIVVATATWTAQDGTKVFADFVGPVKTGKVTLRSEPPRPKNEILALVLFGTADGANATPPPAGRAPDGTTKAATAVGGGFATQGLSEAIDDLTGLHAQARIDTTSADNPRPEVDFQLSPRVSVEFAHVLGNPPISEPDRNYATLDWRFKRNWSLETTFGDRGTTLFDAVWQRRY